MFSLFPLSLTVVSLLMILPPPETVTVASPGFSLEADTLSTLSADFLSPPLAAGSIWKFLMVSSTDLQPSSGRNDLWIGEKIEYTNVVFNFVRYKQRIFLSRIP